MATFDLEEIKSRLPMLEVCRKLDLVFKRSGVNQVARCPFHAEKGASFTIHANGPHHAKCYGAGCGWRGDIFQFWQDVQGCTKAEAINALAGLAGVGPLPEGVKWKTEKPKREAMALDFAGKPRLPELRKLKPEEMETIAARRGVSVEALQLATREKLVAFGYWPLLDDGSLYSGSRGCWIVTDNARWNASFRRMDGEPWRDGVKALGTANNRWPAGVANLNGRKLVLLVEGSPDLLAALHLIAMAERTQDVAAVCMFGGENSLAPEALEALRGCRVRIVADNDPWKEKTFKNAPSIMVSAGVTAAGRWLWQCLDAGIDADVVNLSSLPDFAGKDLNDLVKAGLDGVDVDALVFGDDREPVPGKARLAVQWTTRPARAVATVWQDRGPRPGLAVEPEAVPELADELPSRARDGIAGGGDEIPAECYEREPSEDDILAALLLAEEKKELDHAAQKLRDGGKLTKEEKKKLEAKVKGGRGETNFDVVKAGERLKVHWVIGDGGNYYVDEAGDWLRVNKERLEARMQEMRVPFYPLGNDPVSPAAYLLRHIEQDRKLHRCLEGLAGYPRGVTTINGLRTLLQRGPSLIQPRAGKWETIDKLLKGRLWQGRLDDADGGEQLEVFHGWMRHAMENLLLSPDENLPGQVLAMAGDASSGKSRLQKWIITPLLGGREADPQPYLFGQTDFNDEWMGAEHLKMEDPQTASKMHDRVEFARRLKGLVVNEGHRWRGLYRGAMTVDPKFRVTLSFNIDPDAMRFFPPLTPDFRDKVIFFRVYSRPMPMASGTAIERKQLRDAIAAELPAYAHWLLHEFRLDPGLTNERFGVKEYANNEIAAFLVNDSPAAEFLALIDGTELTVEESVYKGMANRGSIWHSPQGMTCDEAMTRHGFRDSHAGQLVRAGQRAGARVWIGQFPQLQEALEHPSANWRDGSRKLIAHNQISKMMGTIARDISPDRMAPWGDGDRRFWLILEPDWRVKERGEQSPAF